MLNVFLVFLGFLVMVLLHLIDWRFWRLANSVFQPFPRITKVIFAALLAFGYTCEIRIMWVDDDLSPAWTARLTNAMLFFANLLVASLASLAFPDALPSLGRSCQRVGQRIIGKLHSLFTRIQQFDLRRDPPVLPITNMDTGNPAPSQRYKSTVLNLPSSCILCTTRLWLSRIGFPGFASRRSNNYWMYFSMGWINWEK